MPVKRIAAGLLLLAVAAMPVSSETWSDVAEEIGSYLDRAVELYREGKAEEAKAERYDAYFRVYELKEMEQAVQGWFGGKHNFIIEDLFAEITRAVNEGRSPEELAEIRDELMALLRESAAELDVERPREDVSHGTIFFKAFIVLLREGMEAILILGAMIAVLIKRKRKDQMKTVYLSALGGVLMSVVLAFALNAVIRNVGVTRGLVAQEIFEGFVILAAVAILLWVGGWLARSSSSGAAGLKRRVDQASADSRTGILSLLAFLAVFREGAETVLFYQAMFSDVSADRYGLIGLGIAAAAAVLVLGFLLVRFGSVRLPLKLFFTLTGLIIFYLAFSMAGRAFLEFKEAGWFEGSVVNFPTVPWLGIYPILPGLLLQAAILVFAVAVRTAGLRKSENKPSKSDGV